MTSRTTFSNLDDDDTLLWGARAIGRAIGLEPKAAFRLLEAGKIKSAKKRDGRWTAWRLQLRREFGLVDTGQKAFTETADARN